MNIRPLAITATLLAGVSIAATAQARPMTPEDVAKLESVGSIAVSPDGSRIAYTTASLPDVVEGEENGATTQQLKLAYAPMNTREFLPADMEISNIDFSPDGRMMSFLWSDEDEDRAVYGIPVDGGAYRKLAAVEGAAVRSYAWSPDGSHMHLLVAAAKDEARDKQRQDAVAMFEKGNRPVQTAHRRQHRYPYSRSGRRTRCRTTCSVPR